MAHLRVRGRRREPRTPIEKENKNVELFLLWSFHLLRDAPFRFASIADVDNRLDSLPRLSLVGNFRLSHMFT